MMDDTPRYPGILRNWIGCTCHGEYRTWKGERYCAVCLARNQAVPGPAFSLWSRAMLTNPAWRKAIAAADPNMKSGWANRIVKNGLCIMRCSDDSIAWFVGTEAEVRTAAENTFGDAWWGFGASRGNFTCRSLDPA